MSAVLSFTVFDASAAPCSVRATALSSFWPTVVPSFLLHAESASTAALRAHRVRVFIIEVLSESRCDATASHHQARP
jgi:hypothetical protein